MNDKTRNNGSDDGGFEHDLAMTSRAYKNAGADSPPPAMDDAIRAAARRAVKSQPHAIGKSWISRWSAPISAAALVVLAVSVGFVAIEEQPELAPAPLKTAIKPKTPPPAAAPVAAEPDAAAATGARSSPPTASVSEKKARLDRQSASPRDQIEESTKPELEGRRFEAGSAANGAMLAKERGDAVAFNSPVAIASSPAAASPTPAKSGAKDAQSFASDPPPANVATAQEIAGRSSVDTAKREVAQDKPVTPKLASAGGALRNDGNDAPLSAAQKLPTAPAPAAPPVPVVASGAAIAPSVSVTASRLQQALADKSSHSPDVWMKRILELKQQGKSREFEEELAKFRKRYPDFALPEELKAPK